MKLDDRFVLSIDDILINGWTYGQVWANAERLVDEWRNIGLKRGDRAVLMFKNDPSYIVCYLACAIGGFTAVAVSVNLLPETVKSIVEIVKPALIFREPPKLRELPETQPHPIDHSGPFAVIFTSGTTGTPKGICFTMESVLGIAEAFARHSGMNGSTVLHHVLSPAFNAGFINGLMAPMMAGGRIITDSFSMVESRFFAGQGNFLILTPTMAASLCRYSRDKKALDCYETIQCTGGRLTPGLRTQFLETFGKPLRNVYGITELVGPLTAQLEDGDDCGSPIEGVEIKVRPGWADSDSGYGGDDEIWIKSPYQMLGYLTEDGIEPPKLTWDGYYETGDTGFFHKNLRITGRKKDQIKRGDVVVSPQAVEDMISKISGVAECAVVGTQHDMWGEIIVACVIPRSGDLQELKKRIHEHCVKNMSANDRPDRVCIMFEFPRANGKVKKNILRDYVACLD